MRRLKITFLTVIAGLLVNLHPTVSHANNLALGTISVVGTDEISFTISWNNSWYVSTDPNNWDAVWIFVKYKDCATTNWQHASLSTVLADHGVSGGGSLLTVEMPAVNDGKGVFIRRSAVGSGNIAAETVTLKLDGINTGNYNFKVFGIEMVKVLNENFQIGDGTSNNTFNNITVNSENQILWGTLRSCLDGDDNPIECTDAVTLPAAYPKGWNAFYSMKYEITQEQYVDFLNTLTYDQQTTHTAINPNSMAGNWAVGANSLTTGRARNGIKIKTTGIASTTPAEYGCDYDNDGVYNEITDGQNIACNYINWVDVSAYLDWACLRPMTELEFEKICRGNRNSIGGEYAWGSTTITSASTFNYCGLSLSGTPGSTSESISYWAEGLCVYFGCAGGCDDNSNTPTLYGPARVGFAATASTTRTTAGASYYGAMEMSGNVMELTIAANASGSTYTGTLGDGTLDATGNRTNADWPSVATSAGTGQRGNGWRYCAGYGRTSDRTLATTAATARNGYSGGRGIR